MFPTVSLRCCERLGWKLSDTHTCGQVCSEFPACLPPLTALKASLARFYIEDAAAEQNDQASAALLQTLLAAITEGMKLKDDREESSPNDQ